MMEFNRNLFSTLRMKMMNHGFSDILALSQSVLLGCLFQILVRVYYVDVWCDFRERGLGSVKDKLGTYERVRRTQSRMTHEVWTDLSRILLPDCQWDKEEGSPPGGSYLLGPVRSKGQYGQGMSTPTNTTPTNHQEPINQTTNETAHQPPPGTLFRGFWLSIGLQ